MLSIKDIGSDGKTQKLEIDKNIGREKDVKGSYQ